MPRIEDRTLADQIHEAFVRPQPSDCIVANYSLLANRLREVGEVVYQSHVLKHDKKAGVISDRSRADAEFPDKPIPPDDELAQLWGIPSATDIPLVASRSPTPPTEVE